MDTRLSSYPIRWEETWKDLVLGERGKAQPDIKSSQPIYYLATGKLVLYSSHSDPYLGTFDFSLPPYLAPSIHLSRYILYCSLATVIDLE